MGFCMKHGIEYGNYWCLACENEEFDKLNEESDDDKNYSQREQEYLESLEGKR